MNRGRPGYERLPGVPDGLLQLHYPGQAVEQVAIEYSTPKYSDAQIARTREMQKLPALVQVAATARTAQRVQDLIGLPCGLPSSIGL